MNRLTWCVAAEPRHRQGSGNVTTHEKNAQRNITSVIVENCNCHDQADETDH